MAELTLKMLLRLALFILMLNFSVSEASSSPDLKALMAFKAGADATNKLATWNATRDPCAWDGVSCRQNRVSRLVLEGLDLAGGFQPLTSLTQLRVLSLKWNRFSGPIPDLSNLTALKLLFLSKNQFTGAFPASISALSKLYRLDLSYNNFSGQIPAAVNRLTHLLTLRLEGNRFAGSISGLNLPNLQDFNVSDNLLAGEIPKTLSGFPGSAFSGNPVLCGSPLSKCSFGSAYPTRPGSDGALASPVLPHPGGGPGTVASSPTSMPANTMSDKSRNSRPVTGKSMSLLAVIAIIVGDVLVLAIVSALIYCYFFRNYAGGSGSGRKASRLMEGEKMVYSASPYPGQVGLEKGRMVFFDGERRFELEDLLRASAEMLGKGGMGTAYKAVLDDGNVVAVKRLREAQVVGNKQREMEQHIEVLGRLRHPNVVSLKAYYFAREEKLLVYDYMPNASLFWLLHGNRGPGRTPLDWTTRLKIAAGAARGLAFIHNSCRSLRLTHGNIKSSNVLLDKSANARISDCGLSVFAPPALRSNGYRAPESSDGRKFTQKSDVYSFGVLLLELLTGKCPSAAEAGGGAVDLPRWVQSVVREEWTAEVFDLELMRYKDIEEEMVGLLQVAMTCTSASPDQRPKMSHVVKMIEDIRGVEVSPCYETFDSESPSVSEDAGGASQ
ncbi:probable leucine-rich repeat receptor-like protein kinase At1g68400 [Malania oleifera]|uniref:probable leucine-rich repeat receptor-like protein kinase At1g68400 n=1 Tax=Malania oleifera TaxID=397392 RepID=UPI0025AE9230|nr:probable leucine-rich repeat receptor-like protein kinase At1g68400 [Malania oleifera]